MADGQSPDNGGGVYVNNSGTLIVLRSTFDDNSAPNGGGIYNTGTLSVVNSTFYGNSASNEGGGIYNDGTSPSESDREASWSL